MAAKKNGSTRISVIFNSNIDTQHFLKTLKFPIKVLRRHAQQCGYERINLGFGWRWATYR
jgi:hypothetical protein